MPFGKHVGLDLSELPGKYLEWLRGRSLQQPLSDAVKLEWYLRHYPEDRIGMPVCSDPPNWGDVLETVNVWQRRQILIRVPGQLDLPRLIEAMAKDLRDNLADLITAGCEVQDRSLTDPPKMWLYASKRLETVILPDPPVGRPTCKLGETIYYRLTPNVYCWLREAGAAHRKRLMSEIERDGPESNLAIDQLRAFKRGMAPIDSFCRDTFGIEAIEAASTVLPDLP